MKTWTISDIYYENPCPNWTLEKIRPIIEEFGTELTTEQILKIGSIPVVDRIWVATRNYSLPKEVLIAVAKLAVNRVVERSASAYPKTCEWARKWIHEGDMTDTSLQEVLPYVENKEVPQNVNFAIVAASILVSSLSVRECLFCKYIYRVLHNVACSEYYNEGVGFNWAREDYERKKQLSNFIDAIKVYKTNNSIESC